jgi:hypothetical protein
MVTASARWAGLEWESGGCAVIYGNACPLIEHTPIPRYKTVDNQVLGKVLAMKDRRGTSITCKSEFLSET